MSMNIFRLSGDLIHLASILLLLFKLRKSKSCVGISCRMQEVYLIVFVARYLDLFVHFMSIYNTAMKVTFITFTGYTIYLMRFKPPISQTYDRKADSFPYEKYLVPPAIMLAFFTTDSYFPSALLWTFSIWLECVAIIPQLVLLQQVRDVENLTSHYVAAMGIYRLLYIVNWVYRHFAMHEEVTIVSWVAGVIQTLLYVDFFYYYAVSKWYGQKLVLPFNADV